MAQLGAHTFTRTHWIYQPKPTTTPSTAALMLPTCVDTANDMYDINLAVASGNVLSLCHKEDVGTGAATPCRLAVLLNQFHEAGIHIVGLQESRIRHHKKLYNQHYWLLHAPATQQGCIVELYLVSTRGTSMRAARMMKSWFSWKMICKL